MIEYRCDRCGDSDQLHTREVKIRQVDQPVARVVHLCGYCHSRLDAFLKGCPVEAQP